MKSQMFNFNIINEVYTNGLSIREAYAKNGFDVNSNQVYLELDEEFVIENTKRSFKDIAKQYVDLFNGEVNYFQIESLEREEPLLKMVKDILGLDAFSAYGYVQTKLKLAVYENSNQVQLALYDALNNMFKVGNFYSSGDIKDMLKSLFDKLKLTRTAKATLIHE
jgi:hypothetical protein